MFDIDYDGGHILEEMAHYVEAHGGHEVWDLNLILYGYWPGLCQSESLFQLVELAAFTYT